MFRPLIISSLFAALAACSSTPPASVGSAAIPTVTPASSSSVSNKDADKLEKLNKELASRSIYFSYDQFSIDAKYQATIQQNAALVKTVPGASLVLEGNADERGSGEYNLALGQKRADMVRQALTPLGVADNKVETISLGKEKPQASCHDESCWSQNRRVDFVVKAVESKN